MPAQRARDARARLGRRRQLLAAAASCLDSSGYAATTMSGVAAAAGLAKGTTYLYFRSKEALFSELLLDDQEEWIRALEERSNGLLRSAGRAASDRDASALALALAETLAQRPRLVALLALRHPVLTAGLDRESTERFERRRQERLEELGARLETAVAPLAPGGGLRLLLAAQALAAGCADLLAGAPSGEPERAEPARSPAAGRNFTDEVARGLEAWVRAELGRGESGSRPPAP